MEDQVEWVTVIYSIEQPDTLVAMQFTSVATLRNCIIALAVVSVFFFLGACQINNDSEAQRPINAPTKGPTISRETSQEMNPGEPDPEPSGSIIYLTFVGADAAVVGFDVSNGSESIIFTIPPNGWITHLDASPDYSQLVLAYTPPASWGGPPLAESSLFLMPSDGSSDPELLLGAATPQEAYITPAFSADGRFIYYSHMTQSKENDNVIVQLNLERINVISGEIEEILQNAMWPSLSPDGALLAYLTSEQGSSNNFLNLAGLQGEAAGPAVDPEIFRAVDAHIFSPGSDFIYFSGALPESDQSELDSFWSRLTGLQVANAHSFPADWWRIPVDGSGLEKITSIQETGLAGAFSPDGHYMTFIGSQGIYLMEASGTGVTLLRHAVAFGTVAWIP